MKNNPIFFFQTKIAAFCCRSVCSSSVYYPPFDSVLSVFIFHLPYKLTQGGAGSLVHVVEAAANSNYVENHIIFVALGLDIIPAWLMSLYFSCPSWKNTENKPVAMMSQCFGEPF